MNQPSSDNPAPVDPESGASVSGAVEPGAPAPDVIVTAPGSLGDVNPLLAIAAGLKQQGLEVVFAAAQRYLPLAQQAGLRTRILTSEKDFHRLVSNPSVWHPRQGARLILRDAVREMLEPHFAWLETAVVPGRTILVSHLLDFAGRVFRERFPGTGMATVVLAPAMLRSASQPPRLSSYRLEQTVPRWLRPLAYRCADLWVDSLAGPAIHRLQRRLGLKPARRLLNQWWFSPDLVLGLFPEWFSVPAADCPANFRHCGFPLADSAAWVPPETEQKLETILQSFGAAAPVVFAPGTAHHHARSFLQTAIAACRQLGLPGILLSTDPDQIPEQLPPGMIAEKYLPFSLLLPRAAAIVHHGGVGTTSQAFAAGIPQVVLPMAFDQFDNAERVVRAGCGVTTPMRHLTTGFLTDALRRVLPKRNHCQEFRSQLVPGQQAVVGSIAAILALAGREPTAKRG